MGGLASLAIFGQGGETTGSKGALQSLLTAPAGDVLLVAIAIGLVGYGVWRCLQAILDADAHGTGAKGLVIRAGLLVSAVTHTLLAFFAISLVFTLGQGGGGGGGQGVAGWLMKQPFGQWLVGIAGALIIGAGIAHIIKAVKGGFDRHFDMDESTKRWAYPICRFGLATRGVVFMIVGGLFILAAWHASPGEAGGISEVFSLLGHQIYGRVLLGIMATGLFAFGLYSLLLSAYRRIDPNPKD